MRVLVVKLKRIFEIYCLQCKKSTFYDEPLYNLRRQKRKKEVSSTCWKCSPNMWKPSTLVIKADPSIVESKLEFNGNIQKLANPLEQRDAVSCRTKISTTPVKIENTKHFNPFSIGKKSINNKSKVRKPEKIRKRQIDLPKTLLFAHKSPVVHCRIITGQRKIFIKQEHRKCTKKIVKKLYYRIFVTVNEKQMVILHCRGNSVKKEIQTLITIPVKDLALCGYPYRIVSQRMAIKPQKVYFEYLEWTDEHGNHCSRLFLSKDNFKNDKNKQKKLSTTVGTETDIGATSTDVVDFEELLNNGIKEHFRDE